MLFFIYTRRRGSRVSAIAAFFFAAAWHASMCVHARVILVPSLSWGPGASGGVVPRTRRWFDSGSPDHLDGQRVLSLRCNCRQLGPRLHTRLDVFANRPTAAMPSLSKTLVVLAVAANGFLAPAPQRPATVLQAATIAAKDVSALRKASGNNRCKMPSNGAFKTGRAGRSAPDARAALPKKAPP